MTDMRMGKPAKVPHSETRNTNIENYVSEIYGIMRCGVRHRVLGKDTFMLDCIMDGAEKFWRRPWW